ncbi:MAG TPA: alpha/beta hydrolase [Ktedonobacteraceae bacterium]|jgi:phospholipase/carboxylesterase/glyoxalase family protein
MGDMTYIHIYEPGTGKWQGITLFLLHGTGGDENALAGLGRMVLPGAGQLRPRGNVLEQGMPRFFRRFAEGVLDIDDLKVRTNELADFLLQAGKVYGFRRHQVIVIGFSNGANIASSMLLTRPEVLQSAILLHPMFTFEPEILPDLRNTPVFIGAGRQDPLVPSEQTGQLASLLERASAPVELFWHNSGHEVNIEEVRAARHWLERQKSPDL